MDQALLLLIPGGILGAYEHQLFGIGHWGYV